MDLKGGTYLLYEADLSKVEKKDYDSVMQGLRDVIERKVNFLGVKEPIVQTQKVKDHYRLIVKLAGVKDPAEAVKEIGKTPLLEFREPKENYKEIIEKRNELRGKTEEEIKKVENWQLALEDPFKPTPLTGHHLKKAELGFDSRTGEPIVLLEFDKEGAKIFRELTKKYQRKELNEPIGIYIDGILISAPVPQEEIASGRAQISGNPPFKIEEAKKLARNLNAGALPVPIHLVSQKVIGPSLGKISLEKSLKAGLWGFLAVILFLILFYRFAGVFAALSLVIYVSLMLAAFKLIPVTLTLAGIGGFILSIGMAVDANILIFSRMREELREGKNFSLALEEGFGRAWPSIRDGNMTTLLVAIILFYFGTSFVKGFALTLTLGILVSMFSAIFITRTFLRCFKGTKLENWRWLWK